MARVTLANIPALPTPEWRALCYTDARKCNELLQEFGEQQDHGERPETWSVPRMLQEARYCLEFYSSGSVADRCADGDAEALNERRQLERFIGKWSKLWAQRQALIAKKTKSQLTPTPPAGNLSSISPARRRAHSGKDAQMDAAAMAAVSIVILGVLGYFSQGN